MFADEGPVKVGEEEGRPPSHSSGYGSSQHIYGEVEERDGEGEEEDKREEEAHLPQRGDIGVVKVETLEQSLEERGIGPFFLRVSPPPTTEEEVGSSKSDGVVAFNPDFLAQVEVRGRPLLQQEEDSMVTRSLLELTNPTGRGSRRMREKLKEGRERESRDGEKRPEDVEVVIQQLGRALTKTKGIESLTKAVAKGKGRRGIGRREEEERRRSGRRELEERRKAAEVGRSRRGEERLGRRRREDRENSHRGGNGWRPPRKVEAVEVAGRGNWKLASPSPTYSNLLPSYPSPYSSLQTSAYSNLTNYSRPLPPPPRARERLGSSLTLGEWGKAQLGREERKRRAAVVVCKSLCFLLLLTTFILVIVAVSVFLSKGRNHFGPM